MAMISPSNPYASKSTMRILLVILTVLSLPTFSLSASSDGYNVYNYDLTTPMFTPDGRLKQVEYACASPSLSSPMIIIPLQIPIPNRNDNDNDNDSTDNPPSSSTTTKSCVAVIVASMSVPPSNPNDSNPTSSTTSSLPAPPPQKGQRRIIELPLRPTQNNILNANNHPNGSSLLLGLNGLLSDNISLLQTARQHLQTWYQTYGIHPLHSLSSSSVRTSSSCRTAERVATALADKCQEHSFGGGIRTFGASLLVCAVDWDEAVCLFVRPSGSLLRYHLHACTTGTDTDTDASEETSKFPPPGNILVEGGDETVQRRVRASLLQHFATTDRSLVKGCCEAAVHALLKEYQREQRSIPGTHKGIVPSWISSTVDLVLFTAAGGVSRLTQRQIEDFVASFTDSSLSSSHR